MKLWVALIGDWKLNVNLVIANVIEPKTLSLKNSSFDCHDQFYQGCNNISHCSRKLWNFYQCMHNIIQYLTVKTFSFFYRTTVNPLNMLWQICVKSYVTRLLNLIPWKQSYPKWLITGMKISISVNTYSNSRLMLINSRRFVVDKLVKYHNCHN